MPPVVAMNNVLRYGNFTGSYGTVRVSLPSFGQEAVA